MCPQLLRGVSRHLRDHVRAPSGGGVRREVQEDLHHLERGRGAQRGGRGLQHQVSSQ